MTDPPHETQKGVPKAGPKTEAKAAPAVPATRYPFVASAELTEMQSQTAVKARTSDLSASGCYVDSMNPFASGGQVSLRLTHHERTFEALGTVVHSQPGMGMGIAFTHIEPNQRVVLEKWLAELRGESVPPAEAPKPQQAVREPVPERHILSQLISLLINKGILSESEGSSLLRQLQR